MKRLIVAAIVIALVIPELRRYAGELKLRDLNAATQSATTVQMLRDVSTDAQKLRTYPGDWRPLITAGTASMLAGDGHRASLMFAKALERGERPEIEVDYAFSIIQRGGDPELARNAFTRAAWISPAFTPHIEQRAGVHVGETVWLLERKLEAGTLTREELPKGPESVVGDR